MRDKLDALAGLRPRLLTDVKKLPGARILEGQFTAVQQAIGTARKNAAGAAFLRKFVEEAKASGLVAQLDRAAQGARPVGGAGGLEPPIQPERGRWVSKARMSHGYHATSGTAARMTLNRLRRGSRRRAWRTG